MEPSGKLSVDLTPRQRTLLEWIVQQVHDDTLPEEFEVLWSSQGPEIPRFTGGAIPEQLMRCITKSALDALWSEGLINCESIPWHTREIRLGAGERGRRCSLTAAAFTAVDLIQASGTVVLEKQPRHKDAIALQFQKLLDEAATAPLSQLLPRTLSLAHKMANSGLKEWARLEIDGYFSDNPAMTEDVIVPAYRTVAGQYTDEMGRPLVLQDPKLRFVNEERLRYGVAELESLARSQRNLVIRDPTLPQMLREHFGVHVSQFSFHPAAIEGVLGRIRSELTDRLHGIEPEVSAAIGHFKEVVHSAEEPPQQPRRSPRFILGIALLVIGCLGGAVYFVTKCIQPILPPEINSGVVLITAILVGVTGFLAALNEIVELIGKLLK
ncbi:hypothetical protein ACFLUM_01195 [Chloroflexota bacterium]